MQTLAVPRCAGVRTDLPYPCGHGDLPSPYIPHDGFWKRHDLLRSHSDGSRGGSDRRWGLCLLEASTQPLTCSHTGSLDTGTRAACPLPRASPGEPPAVTGLRPEERPQSWALSPGSPCTWGPGPPWRPTALPPPCLPHVGASGRPPHQLSLCIAPPPTMWGACEAQVALPGPESTHVQAGSTPAFEQTLSGPEGGSRPGWQ